SATFSWPGANSTLRAANRFSMSCIVTFRANTYYRDYDHYDIVNIMKDDIFQVVKTCHSKTSILRPGLSDQVADVLRKRILTGELQSGTRLNEVEIAQQLSTSRGPVRDALRILNNEGLVTSK